jgi:hypothetical protein
MLSGPASANGDSGTAIAQGYKARLAFRATVLPEQLDGIAPGEVADSEAVESLATRVGVT